MKCSTTVVDWNSDASKSSDIEEEISHALDEELPRAGAQIHAKRSPQISAPLPRQAATGITLSCQGLDPFTTGDDHAPAANIDSPIVHDLATELDLPDPAEPPPEPTPSSGRGPYRRRTRRRDDRRCRRTSRTLTVDETSKIHGAKKHAEDIGFPLNWFMTIRPAANDNLTPAERQESFKATLKHLDQHCRNHGFPFRAAWVRESKADTDGLGEHAHIALHLPKGEDQALEAAIRRRFEDPHEVDLRRTSQAIRASRRGEAMSFASYMTKAKPTHLRRNATFRRSGPILGARAGVTRNLGPSAIERWMESTGSG